MNLKKWIVSCFISWADDWNREFHNAIESRVRAEYSRMFDPGLPTASETLEKMRTFYYMRMLGTATLLLAGLGLLIAVIALVAAIMPLFR